MMAEPSYALFYVENPPASAAFYQSLLGRPPLENAPAFCLFALENGFRFGFWKRDDVQPPALMTGGGVEIALSLDNDSQVDALYADWQQRGLVMAQAPVRMDFGYTFVALDPDQHRLRVFAPAAPPSAAAV